MEEDFIEGVLVNHESKPEYGPGKIVHRDDKYLHVIFRDDAGRAARRFPISSGVLRFAYVQSDPVLDNLPPVKRHDDGIWRLDVDRITFDIAKERFLQLFPGGFVDPQYIGTVKEGERAYKDAAHEAYVEALGNGKLREALDAGDVEGVVRKALSVIGKVNLLSPFESVAIRDGLKDPGPAQAYFTALDNLLSQEAVRQDVFEAYVSALENLPHEKGKARIMTWPIATVLPFLAQPNKHMLLKPVISKNAADILGFNLWYEAAPNWQTYEAYLRMGDEYLRLLQPLKPHDLIDVQSFFYVIGGGYDG